MQNFQALPSDIRKALLHVLHVLSFPQIILHDFPNSQIFHLVTHSTFSTVTSPAKLKIVILSSGKLNKVLFTVKAITPLRLFFNDDNALANQRFWHSKKAWKQVLLHKVYHCYSSVGRTATSGVRSLGFLNLSSCKTLRKLLKPPDPVFHTYKIEVNNIVYPWMNLRHYIKQKKPETVEYIIYDSTYMKFKNKYITAENIGVNPHDFGLG